MMRKLLFAIALGLSMSAMGQVLNVTSINKVDLPEQAAVAAINPQGDYLLLTSAVPSSRWLLTMQVTRCALAATSASIHCPPARMSTLLPHAVSLL